jgi:hypothetical protein
MQVDKDEASWSFTTEFLGGQPWRSARRYRWPLWAPPSQRRRHPDPSHAARSRRPLARVPAGVTLGRLDSALAHERRVEGVHLVAEPVVTRNRLA